MTSAAIHGASAPEWLRVLRRYMLFSAVLHLIWEIGHIPLYTIWLEGTWGDIAFAIVHCTGGDIPIAIDRMRGVEGKSVSVRVDLGVRRVIKQKKQSQD